MENAIELALRTWYEKDHPLHSDPLHPALGLAGESGELLDLYKKERFKDGVSWWDCTKCGQSRKQHRVIYEDEPGAKGWYINNCYTSKILDELGDLWFYLRILAYQQGYNLEEGHNIPEQDLLDALIELNWHAATLLRIIEVETDSHLAAIINCFVCLRVILNNLNFTLDQVTESNWQKLKDGDNHGWLTARKSP